MTNRTWAERDLRVLWHPCTQMKDHEAWPPLPIKRGEGVWLEDYDGNRYLDAISSWWVNLFGHAHPYINAALRAQLERLEHVLLAGFTHEPAIRLAERLTALSGLTRCFYAENGSAAVEIALKMSFHYWRNRGETGRTEFIALENSYHGETLGALAVGDVALYKETYAPLLMRARIAPSPDAYRRDEGEDAEAHALRRLQDMERLLAAHAASCCAVIVEPLVQAAGGMRMHAPAYLRGLRTLCNRYRVHLIADECAVGFGRTGTMFACEQAGVIPDLLVLAKGMTGGYLPLSAVLSTELIYRAFYDDYGSRRAFLHSHSFTGNPLACTAALASLELFEQLDTLNRNRTLAKIMREATAPLADHPHVAEVRQTGMIVAVEIAPDRSRRSSYPWQERRGLRVYQHGLTRAALLRPLGNVIYLMPPYVIDEEQIRHLATVVAEGIDLATAE